MNKKLVLGFCSFFFSICFICCICFFCFVALGAITDSTQTTSQTTFETTNVDGSTAIETDGYRVKIGENYEERETQASDKFTFFDHSRRDGYYFFVGFETKPFAGIPTEKSCFITSQAVANPEIEVSDVDVVDYGPIFGCYFQTKDQNGFTIDNYYVSSSDAIEGEDTNYFFYGASYKTIANEDVLQEIRDMLDSFEIVE